MSTEKQSDITGTRDDNTLTIEGEGAAELGHRTVAGDEVLRDRTPDPNDRRKPCEKFGHLPKMYRASDGVDYPVTPGVCRTCGSPM